MINISEHVFDENGKEMCCVLEDKEIFESEIYAKIFPELYDEVKAQYHNSKAHFYHLSDKAHKQYLQKKFGLIN